MLTLIQQYIDPADTLTFAEQVARKPIEGFLPKHIFQTYGHNDSFSPPVTMRMYASAGGFSVVKAHKSVDKPHNLGTEAAEFPLTASFGFMDVEYTAAIRQYAPPEGRDGHFVVFDVTAAANDARRFLGMAASTVPCADDPTLQCGVTPQVGE